MTNSLSINPLSPYGKHIDSSCSVLYEKTRDACKWVANQTFDQISYTAACLGYKIGSTRLLNAVFELKNGISLEKTLLSDLHLAACFGTAANVKAALAKKENPNAKDFRGNTPLHLAVFVNNIESVVALLKAGADINAKTLRGDTPLHGAVLRKNKKMIGTLIQNGTDIHAMNSEGNTPLTLFYSRQIDNSLAHSAQQIYDSCASAYNKTRDTCKRVAERQLYELSEFGAYLGYKMGNDRLLRGFFEFGHGCTLEKALVKQLHLAAFYGTVADIKAALAKKENVNAKNDRGQSPLHLAKSAEAVAVLIKAGADINAKTLTGNTPLHLAIRGNNPGVIRALVGHRADIYALNKNGIEPVEEASHRLDILSILHNAESHPAFASETALHAYFDKMFPPCRDTLPRDLKWLETIKKELDGGKDPFNELRSMLAKCGPISFKTNMKYLEDLQSKQALESNSLSTPTLDAILNCLIQNSPLFSKVWESANRHEKWTLHEVDCISKKESLATCAIYQHKIYIEESGHIYEKARSIIFETLNAFQKEQFLRIEKLAQNGMLSREEYALLNEYLEHETLLWTHRIIGWKEEPESFVDLWKADNIPRRLGSAPYDQIHAETYRKQWDLFYGFFYLNRHPEKL